MKSKISLIVALLILVLPVAIYSVFKSPTSYYASAQTINKAEVIEIYTPLCSECQKLKKVMSMLEPRYNKDITFTKIDASIQDEETFEQIKKYNVRVVPTTIFVDKKGNINSRVEGSMTDIVLNAKLKELSK